MFGLDVAGWVFGVALMLLFCLPGYFFGAVLVRKGDGFMDGVLLRLAVSAGVAVPVLTALAVFGHFDLWKVALALLVPGLVGLAFAMRSGGIRLPLPRIPDVFLLLLVGFALVAYSLPAEYIVNTRDPGIYTVVAERLAATGELFKRDSLVEAVSGFHTFYDGKKYPGFFIREMGGETLVVPQFFPGPFALIGFGTLAFGTWGGLFVVPAIGALSVGVAFCLGRELFGVRAAFFGGALMAVSYTQVWWARHPSSEVMAQLLILGGLWLAVRFTRERDALTGVFCGVLLGAAMLVRVDAFLAALALPLLFVYDLMCDRSPKYALRWLYPGVPLAGFAVAAAVYLATFGSEYRDIIYSKHGLATLVGRAPVLLGAVVFIAVAFLIFRRWLGTGIGSYVRVRGRRSSLFLGFVIVLIALWGYFIVPVSWGDLPAASRDFDAYKPQILIRLVWFTTPAVAVLGLVGLLFAMRRMSEGKFIVLAAALSFGFLYTFVPNVAPDLPWATRRFVPVALPVLCLLAGYGASEVGAFVSRKLRKTGAFVAVAVFAVAFSWTVYTVLPILTFRELAGTVTEFRVLNDDIPASEVVFVEMPDGYDLSASTLEYAYGRDVLPYDRLAFIRESEDLKAAGLLDDALYITTDGGPAPQVSGLRFDEVASGAVIAPRLRPEETKMPMEIENYEVEYRVFRVEEPGQAIG